MADRPSMSPKTHYMIVVPSDGRYEVGLADGLYPWKHMATCGSRENANRICTILAMHYRVRSHTLSAEVARQLREQRT